MEGGARQQHLAAPVAEPAGDPIGQANLEQINRETRPMRASLINTTHTNDYPV